ncbi:MAG: asparagine synthase (glutamine-hydrolyzing) [Acidimicrobiaceae bacterium]|nr:asparagine synthase (glutamine-hydrolyzing) [Acidimicrobiaceae bacterium]
MGVKPLYYSIANDNVIFSSEIKSILMSRNKNEISNRSVACYLKYGYIPAPETMWRGVRKLEMGHVIEIDISNKEFNKSSYWDCEAEFDERDELSLDKLDELINQSISLRCDADVEVGCFLSGGYDTSLTAAVMQRQSKNPIKTFNVGFDDADFDESVYARKVAEYIGSEHYHVTCTPDFVKQTIKELPKICDDPVADASIFPTILVSRLARKYVKVALSSDGGDELFAGYDVYSKSIEHYNLIKLVPLPLRKKISLLMRNATSKDKNFYSKYSRRIRRLSRLIESENSLEVKNSYQAIFDEEEINKILTSPSRIKKRKSPSKGKLNDLLIDDLKHSHSDQLLSKVDRASMHSSIEAREPFLDIKLIKYASKISEHQKLKGRNSKMPLKTLAHKYIPKELLDRPKQGFSIPIKSWLEKEISYLIDEVFSSDGMKHNIFNQASIEKILKMYHKRDGVNFRQLWTLMSFQIWCEHWKEYQK